MRWPVHVLLALILLTSIPMPASAQATSLAEDGTGDVAAQGAVPVGPPGDVGRPVDLVSLDVQETPQTFLVTVGYDDIEAELPPGAAHTETIVHFEHNGQPFVVEILRSNVAGTTPFFGQVGRVDPGTGEASSVGFPEPTADFEADTVTVAVERQWLRDGDGAAPFPGRQLDNFWVESSVNDIVVLSVDPVGRPDASHGDRMPDDGVAPAAHQVVYGIQQSGHAHLASQEPFRASNGEATTFVFDVKAANLGDEADRFEFNVSGAPTQWDVRTPAQTIKMDGGATADVPVVVRTAFAHNHGSAETFILEMRSLSDDSAVGRIELGVYYPEVPQPAGHHDTLWLHSIDRSDDTMAMVVGTAVKALGATGGLEAEYMNTLEKDDRADEVPSEGSYCGLGTGSGDRPITTRYCWSYPLDPGLVMGLDFDTTRKGTFDVTVATDVPMPATAVEGELVYLHPVEDPEEPFTFFNREETVLATINQSDLKDIGPLASTAFQAEVVPTPESDLIPYEAGAALRLDLTVTTLRPDNVYLGPKLPPRLEAGGRLELPLLEYEDPVEGTFEFGGDLDLSADGPQELLVNPGETALFHATLRNDGDEKQSFRIDLVGSHLDWATLLAPDEVTLSPGESTEIAVAVQPDKEAVDGDRADLVVEASSTSDVTSRALLRFLAVVDSTEDHEDMSDEAGLLETKKDKKSPGPGVWIPLAVAGLAALRRR